jgi:penicillin-binding protein 1B
MRLRAWVRRQSRKKLILAVVLGVPLLWTVGITVEALVRARLHDGQLQAPTRFYAGPIVLEPGMTVDRAEVESHLERLGYRATRRRNVAIGEYRLGSGTWIIGRRAFRHYDRLDPGGVVVVRVGYGGTVYSVRDDEGRQLRFAPLEPELIAAVHGDAMEDRVPVRLSDIPTELIEAILAIEDQRFFTHPGLDIRRIVGATKANVGAGRVVQGASTLTQQLAKNLFLSARRSPLRKLRELAMALTLEARHSKEEILEAYVNQVYLAQDGALAIHGVGRAAQVFFGKDVTQLDLGEAALLAGIIRGPSLYAPFRNPEAAETRRNVVLDVMLEQSVISEREHRQARSAPIRLRKKSQRTRSARYFLDFVRQQIAARHGGKALRQGLAVFTTLDLGMQRAAEEAVERGLHRLEREYPRLVREDRPLQAALVAVDPSSGGVLAMVGGRDYGGSQFNRAAYARRQPGSSFKPIVALAALAGRSFTLASVLEDAPLSVETPAGVWQPVNYDGRFRGEVTLRDALERSLNVPFARLGLAVGPEQIVETARKLGIKSPLHAVPSIALGASEVTPLDMARAFGVLAAGGYRSETHTTVGVLDRAGEVLSRYERAGEQVYRSDETYLVTSALRGAVERGTGRGLRAYGYRGAVAAKSGTTNDFRDAWFIGYTPELSVAVWVGFDDGKSLGIPGARAALPIFARFLSQAVGRDGDGEFSRPYALELGEVNAETGLRAGPGCRGELELFLRGTAPKESCSPYYVAAQRYRDLPSRLRERVEPLLREFRRWLDRGRN